MQSPPPHPTQTPTCPESRHAEQDLQRSGEMTQAWRAPTAGYPVRRLLIAHNLGPSSGAPEERARSRVKARPWRKLPSSNMQMNCILTRR